MIAVSGVGASKKVPRGVVVVSLIATAILVAQLARMSVDMVDPAATGWSIMLWNEFGTRHNCFTGYWAAADVRTARNIWGPDFNSVLRLGGPMRTVEVGEHRGTGAIQC